ncbi:BCCT-family transporter [Escherichia coli]|nr:BCCT-family transporter [Escherichia coli]
MMSNVKKKDVPLISISLVAILFIAAALSLFPQQSADAANAIYTFVTRTLGSAVQVLVLLAMGLVIYLATSKYGNIRLGEGKPEYSTLSWLFMFICAGLGSSTLYWGVAEWAYYYQTPGLNIAPRSQQALEFSVPYSFFHWGISAWATYTLASLIMAYHFHVRKNKGLSLSGIIAAITGVRPQGSWGKLVDLMFLIATVGALTISLVVTAATFTRGLSALTGLPDNFTVQAFVILLSGGIFLPKLMDWYQQRFATSEQNGWLGRVPAAITGADCRSNRIYYQQHHQCHRPDHAKLPANELIHRSAWRWFIYPQLDRFLLAVVDLIHPWRSNVCHPRFPRS